MDRTTMDRKSGSKFGAKLALLASAAVMTATFTATPAMAAPSAEKSYTKAEKALNKGKVDQAIEHAEAAVQAEPRNATYRALLGQTYLKAGRYMSAAMTFGDALELGDSNPRTVLSYALTQTAIGGGKNALDKLMRFERSMDPADVGLAMALAGNPERGVFVLTNALRSGQNTPKIRQNLAYTYTLAGNWRAARVMAAEDVPADQLDTRLSQWASTAKPEDHMARVSSLLGIAPVGDRGVPTALALSSTPAPKPMVAKAVTKSASKPAPTAVVKAPAKAAKAPAKVAKAPVKVAKAPVKTVSNPVVQPVKPAPRASAPAPRPVETRTPVVASAKAMAAVPAKPVAKPTVAKVAAARPAPVKPAVTPRRSTKTVQPARINFVSRPVTQPVPAAAAPQRATAVAKKAPAAAPKTVAKAPKGDSHLVQLGSYNSEAEAKAGWTSLQRKFRDLAAHDVIITKAEVKGKTYYRVAAAGFGRLGAAQMCSTVRSAGRGCFAYVKTSPPKGAVDKGTRIAAASRR